MGAMSRLYTDTQEREDERTELDMVYDRVQQLEHNSYSAAYRIKTLEAELRVARAYIKCDANDTAGPDTRPNAAALLVSMIDRTLDAL